MLLSIVIPVYNNWKFTKDALTDLSNLPADHQIIVVDNGSTDETQEAIKQFPLVIHLRNEANKGFGAACNRGFVESTGQNVMFLNNDIRVRDRLTDWTKPILEVCDGALTGPTAGLLDDNFNFVTEMSKLVGKNTYMSGWNLTSSRNTWNRLIQGKNIGPFDSDTFFSYFEDACVSFYARKIGIPFRIVSVPVEHFGRQTSSKMNLSEMYKESYLKFCKKWR